MECVNDALKKTNNYASREGVPRSSTYLRLASCSKML
jgi:hypothetical protein